MTQRPRLAGLRALVRRATGATVRTRGQFVELVKAEPGTERILEIGPFAWPTLRGQEIAYADVLTSEQIKARAREIGADPDGTPEIDYVVPPSDLSGITERFRAVVSCHLIEHQPNLIGHLQQVAAMLRPGGHYFLIVPDRRYCADHYHPSSDLSEMVAAYSERRVGHVLRSVIEHRALSVHNDPLRHWKGDHGPRFADFPSRLESAVAEFATGEFIDLHAWYFDPDSFRARMTDLWDSGLSPFRVEVVHPTVRGAVEFFAVLTSTGR